MPDLELKKRKKITDRIAELVDALISRAVNEIQTRAINLFTALKTLGLSDDEIVSRIKDNLDDQSLKIFESFASQTGNAAINAGRADEMEARADEIDRYEYSAILDKNTCDICDEADGMTASDPSELPETPNPDCEGGAQCRCFTIAIGIEGNA